LLVDGLPAESGSGRKAPNAGRLRAACAGLIDLTVKRNLTNAAFLEMRRLESGREREKAEAIHALKESGYDSIREAYLREEPALLAAVKRDDRSTARAILNRLLLGIYHLAGNRLELLKSLTLELVVMIYRAAVEAGGLPAELLGINYASVTQLAAIEDEEALCHWLIGLLERLMDGIRGQRDHPNMVLLQQAIRHIEENLDRDLSRDEVARVACLSPSHFSHLLKEKMGRSFRDILIETRLNRAAEWLRRGDRSIAEIAFSCGFCDQSHFGKLFRRRMGRTPRDYRRANRGA